MRNLAERNSDDHRFRNRQPDTRHAATLPVHVPVDDVLQRLMIQPQVVEHDCTLGGEAVNLILSGPGGDAVEFRNLGDGSVPVNESATLEPGTYQIGLDVGGFAQAPAGTGPVADGSFDLQMTFMSAAGLRGWVVRAGSFSRQIAPRLSRSDFRCRRLRIHRREC